MVCSFLLTYRSALILLSTTKYKKKKHAPQVEKGRARIVSSSYEGNDKKKILTVANQAVVKTCADDTFVERRTPHPAVDSRIKSGSFLLDKKGFPIKITKNVVNPKKDELEEGENDYPTLLIKILLC